MNNNLVSIIMPSYNTEKFIEESINSVLDQTYTEWELIIIDDCSLDNTTKIVATYSDSRIRYLQNDKNLGAAISRNYALKEAKGRWIAFLDSDDLWEPEKLEKQISFMKQNNYFFSCTNYCEIDEESGCLSTIVKAPKYITQKGMLAYCWIGCLTVMYDLQKIGVIQIADLKKNNDYAMWLKVIKSANCYCLDETLAKYRKRKGSISNLHHLKLIKYHYKMFRIAEKRSHVMCLFYTSINMICGVYKKCFYVKKSGK